MNLTGFIQNFRKVDQKIRDRQIKNKNLTRTKPSADRLVIAKLKDYYSGMGIEVQRILGKRDIGGAFAAEMALIKC